MEKELKQKASESALELTATDLDVTLSCAVEAKVEKAGATTLPVKRLFSIVRELGGVEVQVEVDDKHSCSLCSGASFFRVNGLPPEDFPPPPKLEAQVKLVLGQDKLKSMLRRYGGQGYGHILEHILPMMVREGIDAGTARSLVTDNPARLLCG